MLSYCPSHTDRIFTHDKFVELVHSVASKVREIVAKHPEIEALAGCGHSGMPLIGAVSFLTGMPMISVRKSRDAVADTRMVNGPLHCKAYLIIDDLISSGGTVDRIVREIEDAWKQVKHNPCYVNELQVPPAPAAILLYEEGGKNSNLQLVSRDEPLELPVYQLDNNTDSNPGVIRRTRGLTDWQNAKEYERGLAACAEPYQRAFITCDEVSYAPRLPDIEINPCGEVAMVGDQFTDRLKELTESVFKFSFSNCVIKTPDG